MSFYAELCYDLGDPAYRGGEPSPLHILQRYAQGIQKCHDQVRGTHICRGKTFIAYRMLGLGPSSWNVSESTFPRMKCVLNQHHQNITFCTDEVLNHVQRHWTNIRLHPSPPNSTGTHANHWKLARVRVQLKNSK